MSSKQQLGSLVLLSLPFFAAGVLTKLFLSNMKDDSISRLASAVCTNLMAIATILITATILILDALHPTP